MSTATRADRFVRRCPAHKITLIERNGVLWCPWKTGHYPDAFEMLDREKPERSMLATDAGKEPTGIIDATGVKLVKPESTERDRWAKAIDESVAARKASVVRPRVAEPAPNPATPRAAASPALPGRQAMTRPRSVKCAVCQADVPVAAKGPLPTYCKTHRDWRPGSGEPAAGPPTPVLPPPHGPTPLRPPHLARKALVKDVPPAPLDLSDIPVPPGAILLLEANDAARALGLAIQTVQHLALMGTLRVYAVTRRGVRLYRPEDVEAVRLARAERQRAEREGA
jgi:hypothetical protein